MKKETEELLARLLELPEEQRSESLLNDKMRLSLIEHRLDRIRFALRFTFLFVWVLAGIIAVALLVIGEATNVFIGLGLSLIWWIGGMWLEQRLFRGC